VLLLQPEVDSTRNFCFNKMLETSKKKEEEKRKKKHQKDLQYNLKKSCR